MVNHLLICKPGVGGQQLTSRHGGVAPI
ncbi:hypothetical protein MPC4_110127 [Methylocella tundrae]|uniref:Uncharacterized protein n=1 Tax=Methylocella tundrae TaxID=227605 RepID=A0A8B6M1B8_METTU|nr:hypothetical protein MPC4_110127 [Methylocella tundrae]